MPDRTTKTVDTPALIAVVRRTVRDEIAECDAHWNERLRPITRAAILEMAARLEAAEAEVGRLRETLAAVELPAHLRDIARAVETHAAGSHGSTRPDR